MALNQQNTCGMRLRGWESTRDGDINVVMELGRRMGGGKITHERLIFLILVKTYLVCKQKPFEWKYT